MKSPILVLVCFSPFVHAGQGDTFTPYVLAGVRYDTNLLRVDDAVDLDATTVGGRSDTVKQLAVGLDVDWQYSRQTIRAHAQFDDNEYQRFEHLDYQGHDVNAAWNWGVGSDWSGNIGFATNRSLTSFNDLNGLATLRGALRDRSSINTGIFYQLHPRWQLGLGLTRSELDYQADDQQGSDREEKAWNASVRYSSPQGSTITIGWQELYAEYPNRSDSSIFDNEYQNTNISSDISWKYSEKSTFMLRTAYVDRKYEHVSERDYDNINYSIGYLWTPRSKLRLDFSYYDRVAPRDNLISNVSENTGFALNASWNLTNKLTLSSAFDISDRKDQELEDIVGEGIKDNDQTFSAGLIYQPYRSTDITLNYASNQRDSNRRLGDYDSQMISLSIRLSL